MKTIVSNSLEETQKIAGDWLKEISSKSQGSIKSTMIGLSGHLGAGKTAFVKAVAKELGIKEEITSPTFVIMKIYEIGDSGCYTSGIQKLVHIDAYRLEDPKELEILALDKLAEEKGNLIMIEWPENVGLKTENQINFKALEGTGSIEISFV